MQQNEQALRGASIHAPLFDICFAIVFAALIWGGLWLRNPRVRVLLPLQS